MNLLLKNDGSCIENDEFCIENDEFCIENDEFCIENDECAGLAMHSHESRVRVFTFKNGRLYTENHGFTQTLH